MSKRREEQARERTLGQLGEVLAAMKNLAIIEIGKLERTHAPRRRLLEELTTIARSTRTASSALTAPAHGSQEALSVLIGSERGFCADFNDRIVERSTSTQNDPEVRTRFIVVGNSLAEKLATLPAVPILASIPGPTAMEDVDTVLTELLTKITAEQSRSRALHRLIAVVTREDRVEEMAILPFAPIPTATPHGPEPELHLPPELFAQRLIEAYVDALLHDLLMSSLLAENHARLAHMATAINRIDEQVGVLRQRERRARQEEITMEIEAILLGTTEDH